MLSKWWEMMTIHRVKTKFKTEWEGSYPVKRIFSDPFSLLCVPYTYNGGQKSLERLWKTFLPHP